MFNCQAVSAVAVKTTDAVEVDRIADLEEVDRGVGQEVGREVGREVQIEIEVGGILIIVPEKGREKIEEQVKP